ncbi:LCP family protein, partial [Ornithinicoccus halotolerans]|uniref:LCP family protein n=1 Tax=Ornithinicoccus halotolerans TaxID=1748220 RepID=UPI001E3B9C5C
AGRGGRGGGGEDGRPPRRRRPRYAFRRVLVLLLVLLLVWIGGLLWAALASWNSVERVAATPPDEGRPAAGSGSTFLLVGTDGRENLTREERNELVTGHETDSVRADTIMLLHLPSGEEPVLVSLPRDSYLEVPGYGAEKLNSAYPLGGPELLVRTVEQATGMRLDGYLEIGFGGFVDVVQTVDGVHMCLEEAVEDERTRLQLEAGCQELAGTEALKYVRMRYSDPRGDLGRVERQRQFLSALVAEMASPGIVLVPWRLHEVGTATGSAMSIGEDTSMLDTARMALGMRKVSNGEGQSVTVPVADPNYQTHAGSSVLWDEEGAAELFEALRTGAPLSVEP